MPKKNFYEQFEPDAPEQDEEYDDNPYSAWGMDEPEDGDYDFMEDLND